MIAIKEPEKVRIERIEKPSDIELLTEGDFIEVDVTAAKIPSMITFKVQQPMAYLSEGGKEYLLGRIATNIAQIDLNRGSIQVRDGKLVSEGVMFCKIHHVGDKDYENYKTLFDLYTEERRVAA